MSIDIKTAKKNISSVARKELRGYFQSPVALIFLGAFLVVVLFMFFWSDKFFTRGVADVRPLFEHLPLLLIFLVAALSMRVWSEEQKVGTIEILLTLPVPRWQLVAGKFLAGMALVALALALTLGLPITVSMMGHLDWGPVIGGYLAALLLAGAYLSIGLCVSALTDNQIVSLFLTVAVCGLLYLPGSDAVAGLAGAHSGDLLRKIGTGSRFESIARGVIDLRDLAYYASLMALFLTGNTMLLKAKAWSKGSRTARRRFNQGLTVGLVAVNAVALNLWLSPVASARIDVTQDHIYSLSPVTKNLLGSLDQPLLIRGYFSEKTHPLLAPLIPEIKDLLAEYKVVGGDKVRLEFVDPASSDEVEKEAQEQYGIKSFPFRFADRREQSVVNAYFHILIKYGDQFQVLTFQDLIEVHQVGVGNIEVKLRNFEYDVTRTIKKVAYGFQSLDALFASLHDKALLTAYITPDTLPDNLKDAPDQLEKVVKGLEDQSGGRFTFKKEVPDSRATQQALYQKYRFQPFASSLLSNQGFYFHFVLKVGDKELPILPPRDITEASLKEAIVDGLKRAAPGFIKTVALWVPKAAPPRQQQMPGMPQPSPHAPQNFQMLRQKLSGDYKVVAADLSSGHVDDDAQVLVLAGPADFGPTEQRAVDQFLMRGGAVIVLDGRYRLNLESRNLDVEPVKTGLEDLLTHWGVEVKDELVEDSHNDSFPIPVDRDLGGITVRDIQQLPYPFFVRVGQDQMGGGVITGQLAATVMHFASPIEVTTPGQGDEKDTDKKDEKDVAPRKVEVLLRSSDDSWLQKAPMVQPDFRLFPKAGFGKPEKLTADEKGPAPLAVAITGSFSSYFADKDKHDKDKHDKDQGKSPDAAADKDKNKDDARLIAKSPPDARLIVVGSSSFATDEMLQLSQQAGSDYVANNVDLVQNMVDWAVADTDLLKIRSRGSENRPLTVEAGHAGKWEAANYVIVLLGLCAVVLLTVVRRKNLVPITLDPPPHRDESDEDDEEVRS